MTTRDADAAPESTPAPSKNRRTLKLIVVQPFSVKGREYRTGEVLMKTEMKIDPAVSDRLETGFLKAVVE